MECLGVNGYDKLVEFFNLEVFLICFILLTVAYFYLLRHAFTFIDLSCVCTLVAQKLPTLHLTLENTHASFSMSTAKTIQL